MQVGGKSTTTVYIGAGLGQDVSLVCSEDILGVIIGNTVFRLDPHTLKRTNAIQLLPGTRFVTQLDFYLIARTSVGPAALDLSRMQLDPLTREQYASLRNAHELDNFAYDL